jgi:hypothetical protein
MTHGSGSKQGRPNERGNRLLHQVSQGTDALSLGALVHSLLDGCCALWRPDHDPSNAGVEMTKYRTNRRPRRKSAEPIALYYCWQGADFIGWAVMTATEAFIAMQNPEQRWVKAKY